MLEVDNIVQSQSLSNVTLFNILTREVVEDLVEEIQNSENPISDAKDIYDFLVSEYSSQNTTSVHSDLTVKWNIEGSKSSNNLQKLAQGFYPSTIEKAAAWLAVITITCQLISNNPDETVVINNQFIYQTETSIDIHMNQLKIKVGK